MHRAFLPRPVIHLKEIPFDCGKNGIRGINIRGKKTNEILYSRRAITLALFSPERLILPTEAGLIN